MRNELFFSFIGILVWLSDNDVSKNRPFAKKKKKILDTPITPFVSLSVMKVHLLIPFLPLPPLKLSSFSKNKFHFLTKKQILCLMCLLYSENIPKRD